MEPTAAQARVDAVKNELDGHRESLYRYAVIHLRDRDLAEDLVQEALLAAVEGADRFQGDSSLRTWLVSILKHKIIDHIRKDAHAPVAESRLSAGFAEPENEVLDRSFDARGGWREHKPQTWRDPDEALEHAQFWEVFQACCSVLPLQTARVFLLREVMGFTIEEICKDLRISTSNCSVILYRARFRLRNCLEHKWFMSR